MYESSGPDKWAVKSALFLAERADVLGLEEEDKLS